MRQRGGRVELLLGACGVFLGSAAALCFPLLWPRTPFAWHSFAACAAALAPIAGLGARPRSSARATPELPRSAPSPARVVAIGGAGLFEDGERAARLAAARGRTPRALWLPPIVYRPRWWALPALALGLAWLAHGWHHPRLWAINLTAEPLRLSIDGVPGVVLEPAGIRVARAAVELRLPRGAHELAAANLDGRLVSTVHARLEGGKDHLYAPASAGRCFWLERLGLGRNDTFEERPLLSSERFFTLDDVDVWFADSTGEPGPDRRSSGGTLTSLRLAPCARAPESVRRAASALGP